MSNAKYKEVKYYGILTTHSGTEWYLLMDKPIDRLEWMNDNERMFLVCQPYFSPQRIIVSGYTLRMDTQGTIPTDEKVEEEAEVQDTQYEFQGISDFINLKV